MTKHQYRTSRTGRSNIPSSFRFRHSTLDQGSLIGGSKKLELNLFVALWSNSGISHLALLSRGLTNLGGEDSKIRLVRFPTDFYTGCVRKIAAMKNLQHTIRQAVLSVIITVGVTGLLVDSTTQAFGKTAKTNSDKSAAGDRTDIFFPAPPDSPRLQYLTGFASEKTFRQKKTHSFKAFITGQQEAVKELSKPYGVTTYDHKIFICDTAMGAVLVADLKEQKIGMLESAGEGALRTPLNIAIDKADGTAYVVDSTRDQVVVFDKKGAYSDTIGKQGEMKPRDVAVGTDRIYIADVKSHNVRIYEKATHKYVADLLTGAAATNEITGLFTPGNMAIADDGQLYVSDTGAGRVQVYDGNGKHVRSVGEMGDGLGMFARLKGIAVDRQHQIYAADAMSQVIQIFNDQGKLLTFFGDPGEGPRIQILPTKVAVDYEDVEYFRKYIAPNFVVEHLVIVINQLGPHKVAVYGYGHKK